LQRVHEPYDYQSEQCSIGISIGIALYDSGSVLTAKGFVRNADNAMYEAKLAGKGTYRLFETGERL
jgi:GGDEF domain-containing protein